MMPAKEVGGDLYDYLLDDKHIYICLGDVSGKGVPASLFMAQAARLFRAMAKQQMMPADIATRLNDELCEGNENGMFVTMFLALINLETGSMDFCNAGHNPPVLGDKFMEIETNAPIGAYGLDWNLSVSILKISKESRCSSIAMVSTRLRTRIRNSLVTIIC